MAPQQTLALGLKARTGSAALVALAGAADAPRIVAKTRIVMATTFETGAVYHAAQELSLAAAEAHVAKSARTFEALAVKALQALRTELGADFFWTGGALVAAPAKPALPLVQIIAAHPRVHAAEGELYRRVVERAAVACGLKMVRVAPTELVAQAARAAGLRPPEVEGGLAALGKASGPPWTKEEKECALAAWGLLS